jgi:hypothetical protein
MSEKNASKYSLLEEVLTVQGRTLKGVYTIQDVAKLFGVSIRAIQDRVARGQLIVRDLPGRGRFLSRDLEDYIDGSTKTPKKPPK